MSAICQQIVRELDETGWYRTSPNRTTSRRKRRLTWTNGQLRTPADNYGHSPFRSSSPPSDTNLYPTRLGPDVDDSRRWPARFPSGVTALRVFFRGEVLDPLPPPEELLLIATEDVRAVLGIEAEPLSADATAQEFGLARHQLGHKRRLERIDAELKRLPGLRLIGGYRGSGVSDAIAEAESAASDITSRLGQGL